MCQHPMFEDNNPQVPQKKTKPRSETHPYPSRKRWWLSFNPFEKYDRQNGFIFPNFRGENKKYLKFHQPVQVQLLSFNLHPSISCFRMVGTVATLASRIRCTAACRANNALFCGSTCGNPTSTHTHTHLQGGPGHQLEGRAIYNSIYRGYKASYPFIRPFIGVMTPFVNGRGPHCWQNSGPLLAAKGDKGIRNYLLRFVKTP